MNLSVILCTYNRCESLRRTLETLCQCVVPKDLQWELLVFDNNSKDQTKEACAQFAARLPLKYIFEARQGKSFALNRAVTEATGELFLFTDDDVDLDPRWIAAYAEAARAYPGAIFFGGKVLSSWQGQPPKWFVDNADWIRSNPRVDWGDTVFNLTGIDERVFIGANIAFRRALFARDGVRYREDVGPRGTYATGNARHGAEEFGPQEEAIKRGHHGCYVPAAVVHHRDPLHRMTEKYIRYYYRHMGEMNALTGKSPDSPHLWFGAPRYLWRKAVTNACTYLATRWTGPSRIWLKAEILAAVTFGEIRGFQQRRLRQRQTHAATP